MGHHNIIVFDDKFTEAIQDAEVLAEDPAELERLLKIEAACGAVATGERVKLSGSYWVLHQTVLRPEK